jgi:hypothetical protein
MELRLMARPLERFCRRGHDTTLAGRDANYYCKECRRESDRRRDPKRRALEPPRSRRGGKHSYPLEWERARVQRWLEITAEDPLDKGGTQERMREFGTRYERLEADVPTPDDETVDA